MRFCDSIFGRLLKPISRGQLASTVERHDGNAYDKVFKSWDHLVALVFAQLGGVDSLRALEAVCAKAMACATPRTMGRSKSPSSIRRSAGAPLPKPAFSTAGRCTSMICWRLNRQRSP